MINIHLIPLDFDDQHLMTRISDAVSDEYKCQVSSRYIPFDISWYLDTKRLQYDANQIMTNLLPLLLPQADKVVAITNGDLFIPILTFIFGQAMVNGKLALVSTHRLLPERYGLAQNDWLYEKRIIKEVIHELGHTFGLRHCFEPQCVMRSSTYVEDIDLKDQHLCPKCRSKIQNP